MIRKIDLPYPLDALEPYYNKETLAIHYNTLYTGYVDKTNQTEEKLREARMNNDFSFSIDILNTILNLVV